MWRSLVVLLVVLGGLEGARANAEVLITREEAALPSANIEAADAVKSRALSRAPQAILSVDRSGNTALTSPLGFKIKFVAYGGTTIDPASVKVVYLKRPMIDLTPRLTKYIKASGIDMPAAELPPGRHEFVIQLQDSNRHPGESLVRLTVDP